MGRKNQLLIRAQVIQHDGKDAFFNIGLNIREMLITVIKPVRTGDNGGEEDGDIYTSRCAAGENLAV